jgi:hypothetical protein
MADKITFWRPMFYKQKNSLGYKRVGFPNLEFDWGLSKEEADDIIEKVRETMSRTPEREIIQVLGWETIETEG